MTYRLKEEYSSLEPRQLVTSIIGETAPFVLGTKPHTVNIPASKQEPARTVTIPVATQAQMAKLHKLGSELIEEVPKKSNTSNS